MRKALWTAIAVCTMGGVGCAHAPVRTMVRSPGDLEIALAIEDRYFMDHRIPANAIDVNSKQGIVTLEGTVRSLLAKDRAREIAESIKGVRAVVNAITVSPPARPDHDILRDATRALESDPATATRGIRVAVSSAVVTLDGTVNYWTEMQLVEEVVQGVRGVREIKDRLGIFYPTPAMPPDREIAAAIHDRISWDALVLNGSSVAVHVEHGDVALVGVVGSASSREQAGLDAWLEGVHSVNILGLAVHPAELGAMLRSRAALEYQPDAQIEKAVTAAFGYDPRLRSYRPVATVQNGVVYLTGVVGHLAAKAAAGRDAANAIGVLSVKNYLKVRPEPPWREDEAIAADIRTAWNRDPLLTGDDLSVSVVDGNAILRGWVITHTEIKRAEEDASRVRGVVSVFNELADSTERTEGNDRLIQKNVEHQLFWNPFVNSQDIQVRVENGVATLKGTVATAREAGAAADAAWTGAARRVENLLVIAKKPPLPPGTVRFSP